MTRSSAHKGQKDKVGQRTLCLLSIYYLVKSLLRNMTKFEDLLHEL